MSDLRERLMLVATDFNEWGHIRTPDQVVAALLPIIEAELQKRDKEHFDSLVKAESECLEETEQLSVKLTETNKLLEQTIQVLEAVDARLRSGLSDCPVCGTLNYGGHFGGCQGTKPLLGNLKALTKEGTE